MTLATTQAGEDVYMQVLRSVTAESTAISPEEHEADILQTAKSAWIGAPICWLQSWVSPIRCGLPTTGGFYTDVLVDEDFFEDSPAQESQQFILSPMCERNFFVLAWPHEKRSDEMLADRSAFGLDAAQWTDFQKALDAPARPLSRMKALLEKPGFFDSGSSR